MDMKLIYGGALMLGTINVLAAVQAAKYFIPLAKERKSREDEIKSKYSFHMRLLKREVKRLERSIPGDSIYDEKDNMDSIVAGYGDYYDEAVDHRIPKNRLDVLGKRFLGKYQDIAYRFEDGVHKFHPEMEI